VDEDFSRLDGVHVLVVEDDDDSREALRRILKHCGALVTTAGTVNEAHRLLALLRPHVLVTDTGIPQDRLGLVRAVQALAQAHGVQIPTVAMTYDHSEQARVLELLRDLLSGNGIWKSVADLPTSVSHQPRPSGQQRIVDIQHNDCSLV
jgi:CheY-like chemotaxis protein